MMLETLAVLIALIIPLYIGYGVFYYKLGRIEGHLKALNGGSLKK